MIIDNSKSNAIRFINAYNMIDQTIRSVYNFKRNMTFSDMIRRTVSINSVVRRYEDKLIDYARLRNAIIHNSNEDYIIAEPHDDVTYEMEKIAKVISRPPLVIDAITKRNVLVVEGETPLGNIAKIFSETGFKTLPVYSDNSIKGIATPTQLLIKVGEQLRNNKGIDTFLSETTIMEALDPTDLDRIYCIRDEHLTIQEAIDIFFKNRRMLAIIITKNGGAREKVLGIVTGADIMDLNKIIEDYE